MTQRRLLFMEEIQRKYRAHVVRGRSQNGRIKSRVKIMLGSPNHRGSRR